MSLVEGDSPALSHEKTTQKIPLVVILGPTAVGKTALSLSLAKKWNGEIVSADSRLFYRGMNIGTAKPTLEERTQVAHHLIDVANPDETWSLARFQQAASQAIMDIHSRGRNIILVGGTGQYIQAVIGGWLPPSVAPDQRLRSRLEARVVAEGYFSLHNELRNLDPQAADRIDPRNYRRTIRALEVIHSTGQRFSEQIGRTESPYRLLKIGLILPRPELYARIDARIHAMFTSGLLEEVKGLLAKGYTPDLPAMTSIGYRECIQVLQGYMTVDEAMARMRHATRVFVRRQANWFKINDQTIHWFESRLSNQMAIEDLLYSFGMP